MEFRYYIYDYDDNLLHMMTPLYFKKNINGKWEDIIIYPNDFAEIRKKYISNYADNPEWKADRHTAFMEFGDYGKRGRRGFEQDYKEAITNKRFGPSWESFLQTIREGRLFGIVTTRGHEPSNLRGFVKYIIKNVFTNEDRKIMNKNLRKFAKFFDIKNTNLVDYYLNKCYFMGLFSHEFHKQFGYIPFGDLIDKGKQDAIKYFVQYVRKFARRHNKTLKVGFSDDDINFSNAAKNLFINMKQSVDFDENFYVFDTSNNKIKGGIKIKI